jgi:AbrB family looped-hinge helix DNA binding protein
MAATATLSRKFQLSLPKSLREAMKLQPGQQFELIQTGEIIQMVPKVSIRDLRGRARGAKAADYRDRQDRF